MTDQELLQAIRSIVKEESATITQRSDAKFDAITQRLDTMQDDITTLKDSVDEVRSTTNYLAEWVEKLETAFHKHEVTTG